MTTWAMADSLMGDNSCVIGDRRTGCSERFWKHERCACSGGRQNPLAGPGAGADPDAAAGGGPRSRRRAALWRDGARLHHLPWLRRFPQGAPRPSQTDSDCRISYTSFFGHPIPLFLFVSLCSNLLQRSSSRCAHAAHVTDQSERGAYCLEQQVAFARSVTTCNLCCVLQERLFDQSDAYRVHVCDRCGLFAVANLKKNQFHCPACKNTTGIVQVRVPSSKTVSVTNILILSTWQLCLHIMVVLSISSCVLRSLVVSKVIGEPVQWC